MLGRSWRKLPTQPRFPGQSGEESGELDSQCKVLSLERLSF